MKTEKKTTWQKHCWYCLVFLPGCCSEAFRKEKAFEWQRWQGSSRSTSYLRSSKSSVLGVWLSHELWHKHFWPRWGIALSCNNTLTSTHFWAMFQMKHSCPLNVEVIKWQTKGGEPTGAAPRTATFSSVHQLTAPPLRSISTQYSACYSCRTSSQLFCWGRKHNNADRGTSDMEKIIDGQLLRKPLAV